ncbi:hypothetical protein [Acidithiobacillus thiooxidans]|uniref:hypothetical protein n=1 Tax=Acidithiobacillus thiooxidans TaxID=930 RepID=UPI00129D3C0B|nr:hypothetical protein [Acidithiobacillus thiooxidans]
MDEQSSRFLLKTDKSQAQLEDTNKVGKRAPHPPKFFLIMPQIEVIFAANHSNSA